MKIIVGIIAIVGIILGIHFFRSKSIFRSESESGNENTDHYTCRICGDMDCDCHKDEKTD